MILRTKAAGLGEKEISFFIQADTTNKLINKTFKTG